MFWVDNIRGEEGRNMSASHASQLFDGWGAKKAGRTRSERKDKRRRSSSSCDSFCRTRSESTIIREVKRWGKAGQRLSSHSDKLCMNPYRDIVTPSPGLLTPRFIFLTDGLPSWQRPQTQTLCNGSLPGKKTPSESSTGTREHTWTFTKQVKAPIYFQWSGHSENS